MTLRLTPSETVSAASFIFEGIYVTFMFEIVLFLTFNNSGPKFTDVDVFSECFENFQKMIFEKLTI